MTAATGTMETHEIAPATRERPGAWHGGSSSMQDQPTGIPYGYCHCGCGGKTKIAKYTDRSKGWVRGEPKRYLRFHRAPQPRGFDDGLRAMYVVDAQTGCWIWQRTLIHGYGQVRRGKTHLAHRYIYEQLVGPIPDGMHLDHLCRTPACVNPAHLEPVTPVENARRSSSAKISLEIANEMRHRYAAGGISHRELGEQFGLSKAAARSVVNGRTWRQ